MVRACRVFWNTFCVRLGPSTWTCGLASPSPSIWVSRSTLCVASLTFSTGVRSWRSSLSMRAMSRGARAIQSLAGSAIR
jgi:hypothetical protein